MIEFFIKALAGVALLSGLFFSQKTESVPSPDRTDSGNKAYAVRTELKEQFFADPEKRIGVYGRYTELKAEGEVPEALSRVLAEVNARAKNSVEAGAERFLAENRFQPAAGADEKLPIRYRNLSYIVNVTRADDILFSILETEMESGIGDAEGTWLRAPESCRFRSAVYDTASGKELTLSDFLKDDSPERGSVWNRHFPTNTEAFGRPETERRRFLPGPRIIWGFVSTWTERRTPGRRFMYRFPIRSLTELLPKLRPGRRRASSRSLRKTKTTRCRMTAG